MHPKVDATSAGMSGVEGLSHVGHAGMRCDVEDGLIVRYRTHRDWDTAMAATAAADEREPAADG